MTKRAFYEILPFFYSGCGIITIMLSNESVGKISGLLLIVVSMMIFHMRLEYRKQRAADAEEELYQAQTKLKKANANHTNPQKSSISFPD